MRPVVTSRIVPLLAAALLVATGIPQVHASGGPGGASSDSCQPTVGGQVGATTPVPVAENATVNCPYASGAPGVPYGPPATVSGGALQPGQGCSYLLYRPIKFVVTAGGDATELDPSLDGSQYTSLPYPPDLRPVAVEAAQDSFVYLPVVFTGKADANGQCTVPNPGWQLGCPNPQPFTNFVVAGNVCWRQDTTKAAIGPGLPAAQLRPYLDQAALLQLINVGTLSSRPDQPHPGLVNIGTCFFVTGASYQGPGGVPRPIQQPATFQMSVSQPLNDGSGRFIFYVFRITLALTAQWDFGDGSSTPDPSLPPECAGVTADIAVSHTYRRYGTFQVFFHERFDVTIQEFWWDANQGHGPIPLQGVIPPITRDLGPYSKQVVQEEGVPVGGA
jgi:hypothetical protein